METTVLRTLVHVSAAGFPGAKIWPNGLGFDYRGWEFCCVNGRWSVCRKGENRIRYGEGPTPEAALAQARAVRPEAR